MNTKTNGSKLPARQFLGKIDNFKDRQESTYFKKMLRAYLKGCNMFRVGRDPETRQDVYHPVLQRYAKKP